MWEVMIIQLDEDILNQNEDEDVPPLQIGRWVLVKYATKKSCRHFVGKISGKGNDSDAWKVMFLKKKGEAFIQPDIPDIDDVDSSDIVTALPEPKKCRRGILHFDVDFSGIPM